MELYIKNPGDPNYDPLQVDIEDEVQQLITQIETILFTSKREILGNPSFGANLEDMIYTFAFNEYEIKRNIENQLRDFCPLADRYSTRVEVEFVRGEMRDSANVSIIIDEKYAVGINV